MLPGSRVHQNFLFFLQVKNNFAFLVGSRTLQKNVKIMLLRVVMLGIFILVVFSPMCSSAMIVRTMSGRKKKKISMLAMALGAQM